MREIKTKVMKEIEILDIEWPINDAELPTTLILNDCDLDGFEDVDEFLSVVFYEEYGLEPTSYVYKVKR